MPLDIVRDRWRAQRRHARRRGIPFLLTFEQWWQIWQQSEHWLERGRNRGQYVMARPNDRGAYEVGNVEIIKADQNVSDGQKGKPKTTEHRHRIAASKMGNTATVGYKFPGRGFLGIRNTKRGEGGRFAMHDEPGSES